MTAERPVYIIDDEPEMCRSLALLLATGGVPAQTFGCADLFLDMIDHLPLGVVICDVRMPGTSGIELLRKLAARGRTDPVIVIAGHADVTLAVEAMRAGALNFLEKPFDAATIIAAVAAGWRHVDATARPASRLDTLSRRERQVLDLIVAGQTSKEAARHLSISPRTVETYRTKLLEKTGATSTAQLIRLGIEAGMPADLHAEVTIGPDTRTTPADASRTTALPPLGMPSPITATIGTATTRPGAIGAGVAEGGDGSVPHLIRIEVHGQSVDEAGGRQPE